MNIAGSIGATAPDMDSPKPLIDPLQNQRCSQGYIQYIQRHKISPQKMISMEHIMVWFLILGMTPSDILQSSVV